MMDSLRLSVNVDDVSPFSFYVSDESGSRSSSNESETKSPPTMRPLLGRWREERNCVNDVGSLYVDEFGRRAFGNNEDLYPPGYSRNVFDSPSPPLPVGPRMSLSPNEVSPDYSAPRLAKKSEMTNRLVDLMPQKWEPVVCHSVRSLMKAPDTRSRLSDIELHELRMMPSDFIKNGISCDLDGVDFMLLADRRATHENLPLDLLLEYQNKVRVQQFLAERERRKLKLRAEQSGGSFGRGRARGEKQHCVFCKKNNEMPCLYNSHVLKNDEGNTVCPILRKYTCPICQATGNNAHTVKYCPLNDGRYDTTDLLLTARLSTGKKRRRTSSFSVSGSPPS